MKAFKSLKWALLTLATYAAVSSGKASDAQTSAGVSGTRGRDGTATATARYSGDVGIARTETRSGRINLARGIAVGVDEGGVTVSVSNAVDPAHGPAVATNFNLSIGRDGQVSGSTGVVIGDGQVQRSVEAGGQATTRQLGGGTATSFATGRTDSGGTVQARTNAFQQPGPRFGRDRGEYADRGDRETRRDHRLAISKRMMRRD